MARIKGQEARSKKKNDMPIQEESSRVTKPSSRIKPTPKPTS